MAFNVSYKGLTDRDIKYTYSDHPIMFTYPHRVHFRPLKEELPLPPLKRYPERFYDYYQRYNIGIPRAPAFRATDSYHIEKIVRRICKPIECQNARRKDIRRISERESLRNSDDVDKDDTTDGSVTKSNGSRKSKKSLDISELIARLQKPTASSMRKSYEKRKEEDRREDHRGKFSPLPPIED